jgi:hypothetical protein
MFERFFNSALSKEQMKFIHGGTWFMCACTGGEGCNVGLWEGDYSTTEQIADAISEYCSCGGRCYQE